MQDIDIVITLDQPFTDGPRPLLWDAYAPRDGGNGEAVLVLHGGGWRVGSRTDMARTARALAARGFIAIAAEYRLLGEAAWPAQLEDVYAAIRAIRSRNLAQRVFVLGYSAGATLALLAASAPPLAGGGVETGGEGSNAVAAVAAFFPITRLAARHMDALGLDQPGLERFSPETHAAQLPPTIIFCGDRDQITPPETCISLREKIVAAKGVADLRLYSGLVHEFVCLPGMMELTIGDAASFFARAVVHGEAFQEACRELDGWWKRTIEGVMSPMPAWD